MENPRTLRAKEKSTPATWATPHRPAQSAACPVQAPVAVTVFAVPIPEIAHQESAQRTSAGTNKGASATIYEATY